MGLGLERVETDSHVRKKADLLSKLRINITQLIQSTLSLEVQPQTYTSTFIHPEA